MTSTYQRITLVPLADVGLPAPLPLDLLGLDDTSLADVPLAVGVPAATQLGYLNTGFLPIPDPPPPPPTVVVSNVQLRIALSDAALLDDMDAAVAASPDPNDDIRWHYASVFQIDEVFIVAAMASVGINRPAIFAAAQAVPPS